MIVKEKHNLKPITQMSKHYKLYKDGKHLVTAGIASLSVIGVLAVSSETTVHADTTNNSTSGTQQTATGGNAVTATTASTTTTNTFNPSSLATSMTNNQVAESKESTAGTITQPVNIDHSQLNNAVDQARQAGLTVNQQPTTTQTVNQDQVDAAKQNIQNDEAKQAQQIQTITRQHQTEVSNVNNFNGSKGDTSQLDAKVKEAQSIPGLTVVHDQDQASVKKASDTEGIQEAVNNATKSNNDQAQSIQNAIDTQKRNESEYQQELIKWKNSTPSNPNGANPNEIVQNLVLQNEPNASVDISSKYLITKNHVAADGSKYDTIDFSSAGNNQTGLIGIVTFTNLTHSFYIDETGHKHAIVKEVVTLSNGQSTGSTANKMLQSVHVFNNPVKFINYNSGQIDTDIQYYDDQGKLIDFSKISAYISPMSLNGGRYDYMDNGVEKNAGNVFEACQVLAGGKAFAIAGSSVKLHNGNDFYADSDNQSKQWGSPYNLDEWDKTGSPMQYYGAGLIKLTGTTLSLRWHAHATSDLALQASRTKRKDGVIDLNAFPDRSISGAWAELTTVIPQNGSIPQRKTTEVHYHYNPSVICL